MKRKRINWDTMNKKRKDAVLTAITLCVFFIGLGIALLGIELGIHYSNKMYNGKIVLISSRLFVSHIGLVDSQTTDYLVCYGVGPIPKSYFVGQEIEFKRGIGMALIPNLLLKSLLLPILTALTMLIGLIEIYAKNAGPKNLHEGQYFEDQA